MHKTDNDPPRHRAHIGGNKRRRFPDGRWPVAMVGVLLLATIACSRPRSLQGFGSQSPSNLSTQLPSVVPPTKTATPSPTPTKISTVTQVPIPSPTPIALSEGNLEEIQPLHVLSGPASGVTDMTISPDGKLVAASSLDGTIWLWRVSDGGFVRILQGHSDSVLSLDFSPDGTLLASGSSDRTVKMWRVDDGALVRTISGSFIGRVLRVVFSPDGSLFALADHQCFLQLRRADSGVLWRTLAQPDCLARQEGTVSAWGLTFSPDGEQLLAGESRPCCGGSLQLWDVDEYRPPITLLGYHLRFRDLAYSPDGSMLAVAFEGSSVFWLIDADGGDPLRTFEDHSFQVNSLAFSPNGELLISGSGDQKVHIWRVEDGALLYTLEGHTDDVNSVIFSPDGRTIASGSEDDTVILWGLLP
jgi:WD40 repeat protein